MNVSTCTECNPQADVTFSREDYIKNSNDPAAVFERRRLEGLADCGHHPKFQFDLSLGGDAGNKGCALCKMFDHAHAAETYRKAATEYQKERNDLLAWFERAMELRKGSPNAFYAHFDKFVKEHP